MKLVKDMVARQLELFNNPDFAVGPIEDNPAEEPGTKEARQLYEEHEKFSRTRLSKNFIMRDFLYCTYNDVHGICNFPEHPVSVIRAGKAMCETVLEPILAKFGRFAITYGFHNRSGMEAAYPNLKKSSKTSSCPHQWDRGTFGGKVYARVDILPFCVEDGLVSKEEFGMWCMDNLDIDLLMCWEKSSVFCITICPKPRRVFLEWVKFGTGEQGSNKKTYRGEYYWQAQYPNLPDNQKPKFHPSCTGGKMYWAK